MDPNLMSCPTCGHSVSQSAGACTYCGALVEENGPPPQADKIDIGEKAPVVETPPPLPHQQTHRADQISDEAGEISVAAPERSESDVSQQPADSTATAEILEPETEAQAGSPDEWTSVEGEAESKPAGGIQDLKSAPQSDPLNQDPEDNSDAELIETFEPESDADADADADAGPASDEKSDIQEPEEGETIPAVDNVIPIDRHEVQSETGSDDTQSLPEPEVVDKSGAESGEPETTGEPKAEPIEIEAASQESASSSTPEMSAPPEKPLGEEDETKPVKDLWPKKEADLIADAKAGLTSKSLDDTIVLEVENEVEPVAAVLPNTTQESAPSEPRAEVQQKNKPKAGLNKAQTLTKQKVALVKAHALKKQKLVLAKAAALKRKKAAQAKTQADIEAAKKKVSAAAAPTPKLDPGLAADTGMHTLLEKYKGRVIGINYDNSADIRKAQLIEANAEYFSVFVKDQNLKYSYPLKVILSLIEGKDGVDIGNSNQSKKFIAVIKVHPLVLF